MLRPGADVRAHGGRRVGPAILHRFSRGWDTAPGRSIYTLSIKEERYGGTENEAAVPALRGTAR